ncbi:putative pentatricopeptide repeat-containing protein-like [Capsicum annuum]|nr:putative pentatricopeptide repeat-containing protein-like [Capsicum annuum]
MIAGNCSNLREIMERESELVKKLAEVRHFPFGTSNLGTRSLVQKEIKDELSCMVSPLLVSFLHVRGTGEGKMLQEFNKSREWAGLHVADNSCFHYRARLMLRLFKESQHSQDQDASFDPELHELLKDEFDWVEKLIKRYVGREALWLHRRFLSTCWIRYFACGDHNRTLPSNPRNIRTVDIDMFIDNELELFCSCTILPDSDFEDYQAQATFAATYMVWLKTQLSGALAIDIQKMETSRLKSLLTNPLAEMQGKAAYDTPLWWGPSPDTAHSGSTRNNLSAGSGSGKDCLTPMESPPPSAASAAATKVSRSTVEKAVNALLKWKDSKSKIQKPQLLPQDDFIYLNLTLKKIPPKPRTNAYRIPFPHPLHDASAELCLIIDDRPNSKLTSEAAKKIVKAQNIPVTKVIRLSKLKTNYKPFEAKRKLCDSYDLFLVDRRIVHLLPKLLGKQFFKKKKLPLPLDLTHKNWKEQVERACASGLFYLRTGTCCMMRVGKGSMESEQIVDNVVEAIKGVVQVVPKKWGGVRSLHLRLSDSLALPLYQTLPDIKLKIQGFKEKETEDRVEEVTDGLVEVKESSEKAEEGSGKKKRKNKGRIHEVNYMDFDAGIDELGSDDDDDDVGNDVENVGNNEEENSDEDVEESEDVEVEKVKKGKAKKGSILSESNGEKMAKKLKRTEEQKKSKLSLKDGKKKKKKKGSELEKKLKDGSAKAKSPDRAMLKLFYTASLLLALQPLPLEHVNSWVALLHAYANNKLSFYVKKENACLIEEVIYHKEGDGSRIYHMIDFSHCLTTARLLSRGSIGNSLSTLSKPHSWDYTCYVVVTTSPHDMRLHNLYSFMR